jgi:para-aminobenzoate synthetase
MTGAPKLRTMQIIRDVEDSARGVYSGALGWLGDDGRADLGIVIRTLVRRGPTYSLGTGGGITVRSDPGSEYAETRWKAERLLRALHG